MIYLSASSIKDYMVCPTRLYFRKNHSENSVSTDEQGVGLAVHKTTEEKWKERDKTYEQLIITQYNLNDDKLVSHYNRCMSNFYRSFSPLLSKEDFIEYHFNLKFNKDITIVGKIDRLNSKTGSVIDWKTSNVLPLDLSNDPQFIIYHWAVKEIFGLNPSVLLVNLARNKTLSYKPHKGFTDVLFNEVVPSIAKTVDKGIYPRHGLFKKSACDSCSFKETCWKDL